jgi:hypothetical protein
MILTHIAIRALSDLCFGIASEGPVAYSPGRSFLPALLTGHLVLQGKRADCGIASSVIAALCHLGGENANR